MPDKLAAQKSFRRRKIMIQSVFPGKRIAAVMNEKKISFRLQLQLFMVSVVEPFKRISNQPINCFVVFVRVQGAVSDDYVRFEFKDYFFDIIKQLFSGKNRSRFKSKIKNNIVRLQVIHVKSFKPVFLEKSLQMASGITEKNNVFVFSAMGARLPDGQGSAIGG